MRMTTSIPRRATLPLLASLWLIGAAIALPPVTAATEAPSGHLYLVSVGIGDPDNITVRAQKTIAEADIVFGMKRYLRERYAGLLQGKEFHEAGHGLFQETRPNPSRNAKTSEAKSGRVENMAERAALEEQARRVIREAVAAGKTVAILDYGDPTIYGPQAGYLREFADLDPVVIPGISSFNAANAALRRGITQGALSHSVILTHAPDAKIWGDGLDTLKTLAQSRSTMVFFTMRSSLPEFVARMKEEYPGDTPVAIVAHAGFLDKEKVIKATLDTILERVGDEALSFEHLIYVGDFLK